MVRASAEQRRHLTRVHRDRPPARKAIQAFAIVNDIREVHNRPRGEYYEAIVHASTTVGVHWAIVMPGSALVRTIARFIMARVLKAGQNTGVTWSLHDKSTPLWLAHVMRSRQQVAREIHHIRRTPGTRRRLRGGA